MKPPDKNSSSFIYKQVRYAMFFFFFGNSNCGLLIRGTRLEHVQVDRRDSAADKRACYQWK